jgi:tetratricopeptide (TPR) repeat protein
MSMPTPHRQSRRRPAGRWLLAWLLLPACAGLVGGGAARAAAVPTGAPTQQAAADLAARQGIAELMRSAYYWQARSRPDITRTVLEKVLNVRTDHPQALLLLGEIELRGDHPDAARLLLDRLGRITPQASEATELRQLMRLYTQQRSSLEQLRQLRHAGRSAAALALARQLFPDGRPPGALAAEFGPLIGSQSDSWERSRRHLEERVARSPAPRDRLALAELDAQRPATRPRALASLARLAREDQLPADQVRRSWNDAIRQLGNSAQAERERQSLARALPVEAASGQALALGSTPLTPGRAGPERPASALALATSASAAALGHAASDAATALPVIAAASPAPARPATPAASLRLQTQAQALLDLDQPEAARTLLLAHLGGIAPEAMSAEGASHGLLGLADMRLGRNSVARESFALALANDPDDASRWRSLRDTADYWATLAEVRTSLGAPGNAVTPGSSGHTAADPAALVAQDERLQRVLTLPSAVGHEREARLLRADIARLQGRREFASSLVDPLCEADLAAAASSAADPDTRACELALAVRSDDRSIDAGMAELRDIASHHGPGATALLARSLDVGTLRELADQRAASGRSNDAQRLLENTLALRPLDAWLRHDLARLLQVQGHAAAARGLMREGFGLLPARLNRASPTRRAELLPPAYGSQPPGRRLALRTTALPVPRSSAEIDLRRASALVALAGDDADDAVNLLSPDGEVIDADLYARARFEAARTQVRKLLARYEPGRASAVASAGAQAEDAGPDRIAPAASERPAFLPPRRTAVSALNGAIVKLPPRSGASARVVESSEEDDIDAALRRATALAGQDAKRLAAVQHLRDEQGHAVEHQSLVEAGVIDAHRHASAGRGELASRELTVRVVADSAGFGPLGASVREHLPDGRWWAQLDHTRLDAGALPANWSDAQDFGRVRQLGGALALPVDLAGAVPQRSDGLAVGVGWERGDYQADLGLVALGMPVPRWVGGWRWDRWQADGHHLGIELSRRAETGTLLAWAGAVDPVSGEAWGGVSHTALTLRGGVPLLPARAADEPGWLGGTLREASLDASLHLGYLDGRNIAANTVVQWRGSLGLRLIDRADLRLASGLNLDLWHYQRNEGFYSWGHGGYYSPQRYASLSLPLALDARGPAWTAALRAGVSRSRTNEDDVAVFPTDATAQAAAGDPMYRGGPGGGLGLTLRAMGEWQFAQQWRLGAALALEQSSDYAPRRASVYLRHGLGQQPAPADFPLRPLSSYTRY